MGFHLVGVTSRARAKMRLAEEYDAAQDRGEVGKSGVRTDLVGNDNEVATAADLGPQIYTRFSGPTPRNSGRGRVLPRLNKLHPRRNVDRSHGL